MQIHPHFVQDPLYFFKKNSKCNTKLEKLFIRHGSSYFIEIQMWSDQKFVTVIENISSVWTEPDFLQGLIYIREKIQNI